ncbi:MAG: hypothetical protein ACM33U_06955 [Solirubrobacterales bacterium]|nr:hypothetical protein [Solirubrobacterales bacterium]
MITGPNGEAVMLISDACGPNPATVTNDTFTFDDGAQTFVPNGASCGNDQVATYKPSNYLGEDLSPTT